MIIEVIDIGSVRSVKNLRRLKADVRDLVRFLAKKTKEQCYFVVAHMNTEEELGRFVVRARPSEIMYLVRLLGHREIFTSRLLQLNAKRYIYEYCRWYCDHEKLWKYLASCSKAANWQYQYCRYVKDREEMWKALANSKSTNASEYWLRYCQYVKDRREIWQQIVKSKDPRILYWYAVNVKDRKEIWEAFKQIPPSWWLMDYCKEVRKRDPIDVILEDNDPEYLYRYCSEIRDDERVWKALANHRYAARWQYEYCKTIKDRPEMWKGLASSLDKAANTYKAEYCLDVKCRPELENVFYTYNPNLAGLQAKYCQLIRDDPRVWKLLASYRDWYHVHYVQFEYCRYVKDREEMWKAIAQCRYSDIKQKYILHVKDRKEMRICSC